MVLRALSLQYRQCSMYYGRGWRKATSPRLVVWPHSVSSILTESYFERWLTFLLFLCPLVELKLIQLSTNIWNLSVVQVLINLEFDCTKGCESFWIAAWSNTHLTVMRRDLVRGYYFCCHREEDMFHCWLTYFCRGTPAANSHFVPFFFFF